MSTEPWFLQSQRKLSTPKTTALNDMLRYIDTLKNIAHAVRICDPIESHAALKAHDETFP